MTAPDARRTRFAVECLEGRAMMSATLAAPAPEPVELRYELENVLITSYQTGGAASGSHALYQDIFIPANSSQSGTHGTGGGGGAGKVSMQDFHFLAASAGTGGGGAGKVSMNDFHFVMRSAPSDAGEIEIESFSWGETPSLLPAIQKVRDAAGRLEAGEGLVGMTDFAGVPVDDGMDAPVRAGYDLKTAKKV